MRNRKDILMDLFFFKADLSELQNELSQYPWDAEEHVLIVSQRDLTNVIVRCIKNEITIDEIVTWANVIECRDDLDFEVGEMQEIVFELANPEINGEITKERLEEIINELQK